MSEQNKTSRLALTLPELLFVVCIVALLAFLAVKNSNKYPHTSSAGACINNLRLIDAAAYQFGLDHHLTNGAPINFPSDLTPYLIHSPGKIPACPSGGTYSISKVGDRPTCSLGTNIANAHVLP